MGTYSHPADGGHDSTDSDSQYRLCAAGEGAVRVRGLRAEREGMGGLLLLNTKYSVDDVFK